MNKISEKVPFTKADIMMVLYKIANNDPSIDYFDDQAICKIANLFCTIWSQWIEIYNTEKRDMYLIYGDKLFYAGNSTFSYFDEVNNRVSAYLNISGEVTLVFVDTNGLVHTNDGQILFELKRIKDW